MIVKHEPIADRLKMTANCCPKHPGSREFSIFGEPAGIEVPVDRNVIIVPKNPDAEWQRAHASCGLCVILIRCWCCSCGSLTIHVYDAGSGWKTVSQKGWKNRFRFYWRGTDSHSNHKLDNIESVFCREFLRRDLFKKVYFVKTSEKYQQYSQKFDQKIESKGRILSPFRDDLTLENFLDGIESYRKNILEELREFWRLWIYGSRREVFEQYDRLARTQSCVLPSYVTGWLSKMITICEKWELWGEEKEKLVSVISEAIYALYSLRHMSKSSALKEVREKLEQALREVGETPPDLTALKAKKEKVVK